MHIKQCMWHRPRCTKIYSVRKLANARVRNFLCVGKFLLRLTDSTYFILILLFTFYLSLSLSIFFRFSSKLTLPLPVLFFQTPTIQTPSRTPTPQFPTAQKDWIKFFSKKRLIIFHCFEKMQRKSLAVFFARKILFSESSSSYPFFFLWFEIEIHQYRKDAIPTWLVRCLSVFCSAGTFFLTERLCRVTRFQALFRKTIAT